MTTTLAPGTTTLAPATPIPNVPVTGIATARTAPGPTVQTTGATPTPLAFGIATAPRTTTAAGTVRTTAAPNPPIAGSTSGAAVAGAGTSASGTTAGTVVPLTTATRSMDMGTTTGGAANTTAASTTTRVVSTMAAMATEIAPAVRAQTTVVNFLNVVLRNGDLNTFLAPGLRGQGGTQVLGISGNIREFVVTGERPDADGNGTVVNATITTASGTVMKQLHLSRSGNAWVIDRIG